MMIRLQLNCNDTLPYIAIFKKTLQYLTVPRHTSRRGFFILNICLRKLENQQMTKDEINLILKRRIKNGDEFNHLIEKPKNQKLKLEKGDTFYSVAMMKVWVENFYKQVAKLSEVLKGQTIKETCERIHYFLYYDIQYQADGVTQNLRSPANSWFNRREGIDCKSYSIFASSVLMNLGIKHYIRQIKQPKFNPRQFTHVYVVVPNDQECGKLDNGHSIIDGTIQSNIEPNYTDKKDVFMNQKLPHIGLNCPFPRKGLKGSSSRTKKKTAPAKRSISTNRNRFPF